VSGVNGPEAAVQAFVDATNNFDSEAARAVVTEDGWEIDHGNGIGRLFSRAGHPRLGYQLAIGEGDIQAAPRRAAVPLDLVRKGKVVTSVHALVVGADWKLAAISESAGHVTAWLAGKAPALLHFDALDKDADAMDSVIAINLIAHQAFSGNPAGAEMIGALMNEADDTRDVIAWLQHLIGQKSVAKVVDARKLPGINRSVAKVQWQLPNSSYGPETAFLYADSGPPIQWYARASGFSPETLFSTRG